MTKKPTVAQTWGALKIAWRGYNISKASQDKKKMKEYAIKIRQFQKDLEITPASFPELGLK